MVYPEYSSYDTRLDSFKSCSNEHRQFLEQLADAGFFYTGNANETRCFYCSLQVRDWYANNDPWKMHASQMSTCPYLLLIKDLCYTERDEKLWQRSLADSTMSQALLSKKPLAATETQNQPGPYRTDQNQSPQKSILRQRSLAASAESQALPSKKPLAETQNQPIPSRTDQNQSPQGDITRQRSLAASTRSQELPIRRPWEETRNEHIPVLSRTHRNQSSQRDIENMSNNVADLSSRDENSKKGAAYASVTRSFRSDEQSLQCRFCITGVRDYVFMNCRHIVACEKCAYEVTICQICGQKISSRLKVRYS
ncbi:hypothetical protein DMN91_003955 [Ooceraea biroi]|uniref:RING-type domain-containing protein n=2 Tax=Ooceraea biroi TaxID=2015173 RepID=A0A3L8DV26_OOCBI|nr:hypothetical protein DMN91_003955 [Ooceraea biroi]